MVGREQTSGRVLASLKRSGAMSAGEDVSGRVARVLVEALNGEEDELRLAEGVERTLRAAGYGPLRVLAVHARVVKLGGRVCSYHLTQVAQPTALAVPGARQVRNALAAGRPKDHCSRNGGR